MKPVSFIMAAFCFATVMMIFAIYNKVVYFVGNCPEFNIAMFNVTIFFVVEMVGFVADGMELDTMDKKAGGAP